MSEKRKDNKGRVLRNGEVQRADGKYMFRYTDLTGKRRTVYSWKLVSTDKAPDGARCKKALRDMEKEISRDIEDGIRAHDANAITVNDLYNSFMDLRSDLRETTRCGYAHLYNKHVRDELGSRSIKNIRFSDIQRLYMGLLQEKHLKKSSIQSVHALLYQVFQTAVMDNILRINPVANALKCLKNMFKDENVKKRALTEAEQKKFISFVYNTPKYSYITPLITVLLGTGMRIGEALGLRWTDCNFEANTISITHALVYKESEDGSGHRYRITLPKTRAGFRTIPMFASVRQALETEKNKPRNPTKKKFVVDGYTDFIFLNSQGKVYTNAAVFDILHHIVDDYNLAESIAAYEAKREPVLLPQFGAHILRHTFCTRLCENESNIKIIQDVMGHRDVRTTMNVYNEATELKKQERFKEIDGKIDLA